MISYGVFRGFLLPFALVVGAFSVGWSSAGAAAKPGMPDMMQVDNTCLPTSTGNLLVWFGHHGYPNLIMSGATEDDRERHTVVRLIADTNARYDLGTALSGVTKGILKFIQDAGYDADVDYHGIEAPETFDENWLRENDDPNKGFILLLAYCQKDAREPNVYHRALNVGHAVTLVNSDPDSMLIHDPAHDEEGTGRKIVTPQLLTGGTWQDPGVNMPVAGLLLISGDLLEAPPDSEVMVTGAIRITMHPITGQPGQTTSPAGGALNKTIAGKDGANSSGASSGPDAAPTSATRTWSAWLHQLFFGT